MRELATSIVGSSRAGSLFTLGQPSKRIATTPTFGDAAVSSFDDRPWPA
jgi:hypothetical protein